ncbi:hypothetical protein ACIG56_23485 [Nocardia fusca]|uniref:hypothetical protein n=1 Tax=Nocardia fusca TaxID=941183 RepID=UPI0037C8EC38
MQIVAVAMRDGSAIADPRLHITGPGRSSACGGAVAMIDDLDRAEDADARWPVYRAHRPGIGTAFGTGISRDLAGGAARCGRGSCRRTMGQRPPNDFGQILADLTAVALSTGKVDGRAAATADTVQAVLYGTTMIATAAGIVAEYFDLDIETARKRLIRLARAHGVTPTAQAAAIVRGQETSPADPGATAALHPPRDLTPPPHIG